MSNNAAKEKAGQYAATLIETGTNIGIGTGSTVFYFIQALAEKVQQGLQIKGVPTSAQTLQLATSLGIPMVDLADVDALDITVDGADEVDADLQLIKGGGGALLQEKIVAAASKRQVIIVDESKVVQTLGKFPLPVEVIPFGWQQTKQHIGKLGCNNIVLRHKNNAVFMSDHGHYILDCHFETIADPATLAQQLNNIPGVVENGLFIDIATDIIVATNSGEIKTMKRN